MSKYEKYKLDDYVYPHKHCAKCRAMIPEDEDYCSDECGKVVNRKEKKQKKKIFIFIGIYIVVVVVMLVLLFVL